MSVLATLPAKCASERASESAGTYCSRSDEERARNPRVDDAVFAMKIEGGITRTIRAAPIRSARRSPSAGGKKSLNRRPSMMGTSSNERCNPTRHFTRSLARNNVPRRTRNRNSIRTNYILYDFIPLNYSDARIKARESRSEIRFSSRL